MAKFLNYANAVCIKRYKIMGIKKEKKRHIFSLQQCQLNDTWSVTSCWILLTECSVEVLLSITI